MKAYQGAQGLTAAWVLLLFSLTTADPPTGLLCLWMPGLMLQPGSITQDQKLSTLALILTPDQHMKSCRYGLLLTNQTA